jgi:transcriptional regulator with XRE-family HTH domain
MRTFHSTAVSRGHARTRALAIRFAAELRIARVNSGLTQAQLAASAGVTQQLVSLAELGDPDVSLDVRCRLAASCGQELGWRLYPVGGVRLRDSGQMALAQTIVQAAHVSWRASIEVPVAPNDPRAADLVLASTDEIIHIEIERSLVDFQAQVRAAHLKRDLLAQASPQPVPLIIGVPDSRTTHSRLAPFAELIARTFPAPSGQIWRALRRGEPLGEDGILFVRATQPRQPTKRLSRAPLTP